MLVNSSGFCFDGKLDANNNMGIRFSHNVLYKGDTVKLSLLCTVLSDGTITKPYVNNLSLGFKPLTDKVTSIDELNTFLRSNKPCYGVLNDIALIASGDIVFSTKDYSLLSDNFNFYMPRKIVSSSSQIICDKLSTGKGLNTVTISSIIYNAYKQKLLDFLTPECIGSKFEFLKTLLELEG